MSVMPLLQQLIEEGITLRVEAGQLKINAGPGKLTPALLEQLKLHKQSIIDFIADARQQVHAHASIPAIARQDHYEISHAQKRLFVLSHFEDSLIAYNCWTANRLEGELNRPAFEKAFRVLIERHESLRTNITIVEGEPRQQVQAADAAGFRIQYADLRQEPDSAGQARRRIEYEARQPFDLERSPLFRVTLFHLSDHCHVFFFVAHHIISDGWSAKVLVSEVIYFYNRFCRGEPGDLPPLRIHYKDYTAWQNRLLADEAQTQTHRAYWLEQFRDVPKPLEPISDYPRPRTKTFNGGRICHHFGSPLDVALHQFSLGYGVSKYMTLVAAMKALLYRYTGQEDITIGASIAGRDHRELENQIGFYVNSLAIRTIFSGDNSFEVLLDQVKTNLINAYEHQMYPFDRLIEDLDLKRDMSRSPLFDVKVVFQNTEDLRSAGSVSLQDQLDGIAISEFEASFTTSAYDLSVRFNQTGAGLEAEVIYNSDLFTRQRIEQIMDHYQTLLASVIGTPKQVLSRLPYISESEKKNILSRYRKTSAK